MTLPAADQITDARQTPPRASIARYVVPKVLGAATSLILVVILGFFIFRLIPGDPVRSITAGRAVTPEQLAAIRRQLGLDEPLIGQFGRYLASMLRGDLGWSFVYNKPVAQLIGEYLGPTLLLTGTAFVLSVLLGLWLGQRAAWQRGSWFDQSQTGLALLLWSVPTFWLGMLLLLIFSGGLRIFPSGGMVTAGADLSGFALVKDVAWHLVLPALTMTAVVYAQYLMVMRASVLEEMAADYLTTARAKGLPEDQVRTRHAVPNALLPTTTLIFVNFGFLVSGTVTVETVFSWPGLGYLTYQGLSTPDLPLLQGTFVVFSSAVIIMNLVADLSYRFLDPRLKTQ